MRFTCIRGLRKIPKKLKMLQKWNEKFCFSICWHIERILRPRDAMFSSTKCDFQSDLWPSYDRSFRVRRKYPHAVRERAWTIIDPQKTITNTLYLFGRLVIFTNVFYEFERSLCNSRRSKYNLPIVKRITNVTYVIIESRV